MAGRTIMLVAGEASGDRHGAGLIAEIRRLRPGVRLTGMGGQRMLDAGLEPLHPGSGVFGTAGLVEVLSRFPAVLAALRALRQSLSSDPPDLFVPIDFPDFNFRLGRLARRRGVPVVYFIGPQVWAWRRGRLRVLARMVRRMVVILPFEERFYRDRGMEVLFVGHPSLDAVGPEPDPASRATARQSLGLPPTARVIALLPGSRREELRRILPPMLEACRGVARRHREIHFLLVRADALREEELLPHLAAAAGLSRLTVLSEARLYDVLQAAEVAAVASGTATMETALHQVPMVVVYRVSPLTYLLGRALVRLSHFAIVNLVAGREVVPELIQGHFTPQRLERELLRLLDDPVAAEATRRSLSQVRALLGGPGAYARAARAVLELLPP